MRLHKMGHRANSQILKRWADNCGEAFDWYVGAVPGIAWMHPGKEAPTDEGAICPSAMTFDPYEYPRDHEKIFSGTISVRPNGHGPVMQATTTSPTRPACSPHCSAPAPCAW